MLPGDSGLIQALENDMNTSSLKNSARLLLAGLMAAFSVAASRADVPFYIQTFDNTGSFQHNGSSNYNPPPSRQYGKLATRPLIRSAGPPMTPAATPVQVRCNLPGPGTSPKQTAARPVSNLTCSPLRERLRTLRCCHST